MSTKIICSRDDCFSHDGTVYCKAKEIEIRGDYAQCETYQHRTLMYRNKIQSENEFRDILGGATDPHPYNSEA